MSVDLLVFGPHPDDLEIGMGGTVAVHARAASASVLCDLTRGELGSNGTPATPDGRSRGRTRACSARAPRVNLGLPDGGLRPDDRRSSASRGRVRPPHQAAAVALPYWRDRHPDHDSGQPAGRARRLREPACAATRRAGEPWQPDWVCYYFINDAAPPSFVVDVSARLRRRSAEALACHRVAVRAGWRQSAAATRLTSPLFAQLVESRDAQFGALAGVRFAEGFVVREPVRARRPAARTTR